MGLWLGFTTNMTKGPRGRLSMRIGIGRISKITATIHNLMTYQPISEKCGLRTCVFFVTITIMWYKMYLYHLIYVHYIYIYIIWLWLTVSHGKIHHAIKFGKPSISMLWAIEIPWRTLRVAHLGGSPSVRAKRIWHHIIGPRWVSWTGQTAMVMLGHGTNVKR